jgi:hypothetical protein
MCGRVGRQLTLMRGVGYGVGAPDGGGLGAGVGTGVGSALGEKQDTSNTARSFAPAR